MSLEKSLRQLTEDMGIESSEYAPMTFQDDSGSTVVELPDGGVEVDLGEGKEQPAEMPFDANLADYIDENDLARIGADLVASIDADKRSRKDWEDTYRKGLDNLGLKIEEKSEPWPGACAATHPMLGEAVVRFQSQTIGEIFPPQGPVKASVVGMATPEKEKQAKRVQDYMNYRVTCVMKEYRPETEKMLFSLPLAGSAFRIVYFDKTLGRECSMFIPAEDVIVNYAASDIRTAERVTRRLRLSQNEVNKRQVSGFYRDVALPAPSILADDDIIRAKDEITGRSLQLDKDARHELYECFCDIDVPGYEHEFACPYIVTVDRGSQKVLSIYRNWKEGDPKYVRNRHIVHYEFIPGLGFYGFGLVHMIGGLSAASTAILRQLVDAGTLANVPGGLKTRGLRIKGDDTPIGPGEWRDVDVPGGTISDNVMALPYKEPSATLYQLLLALVEAGQRFASMADLKVADMNQEAPVGTTLAIMERAMKVQSAIQARIHAGLKEEFEILADVIKTYTEPAYPYEVKEGAEIKKADFDDRIDIIPVSDPNAATMAQRIMQYQAVLQLASTAPQHYNLKVLHRQIIEVLGVANAENIIPMQEEIPPTDPITENAQLLNMMPVKAHQYQDHEAHMQVHKVFITDPQIIEMVQNSPSGPQIAAAADAHIREHMAWLYRAQIEKELGAELPPLGQPIPPEVEKRLSVLTAEAADNLLGKKQAQAAAEKNAILQQDPIIQQKERELDIRQAEVMRKRILDMNQAQLESRRLEIERELEMLKIAQAREDTAIDAATKLVTEGMKQELESVKLGAEIGEAIDNLEVQREKNKVAAQKKTSPSK